MSVRIRITQESGELHIGDEVDAIQIDEAGDAEVSGATKFPSSGYSNDESGGWWIFNGQFEVIGQSDYIQRIEELEAEVARLRKLLPTESLLPQEVGVWKSDGSYYVRLGEDDWLYANPYDVVRRTDAEMASGTRDAHGAPRIGEKIS